VSACTKLESLGASTNGNNMKEEYMKSNINIVFKVTLYGMPIIIEMSTTQHRKDSQLARTLIWYVLEDMSFPAINIVNDNLSF
jgi:hypothetical protein